MLYRDILCLTCPAVGKRILSPALQVLIRLTTFEATCCSTVVGGVVNGVERMSEMERSEDVLLLPSPHFVAVCVFTSDTRTSWCQD